MSSDKVPLVKRLILPLLLALLPALPALPAAASDLPWHHGRLRVSDNGRYLQHADGTPFFWLGNTGWLLPERLTRDEAEHYLEQCAREGYNVVLVQTVNGVPALNVYGQSSHPFGYDFGRAEMPGHYGYWDHMDFLVEAAARRGIYLGMVCIWGTPVKEGRMTPGEAGAYGTFLAERYRESPNIIWIVGGDITGDTKTEVWNRLAMSIKAADDNHLMTFHPRGRTLSSTWFNDAPWLDFNMFQSGHRRYGQDWGEPDYPITPGTEEDNWRYVERSLSARPLRPVLDGEPSYEAIPKGLHDASEGFWRAEDVRRYAYWSVFAGACGHTYGHNSVMQFYRPGLPAAYAASVPWYDVLTAEGFGEMKHLRRLVEAFPYFERVPDQRAVEENGERYERLIATRGERYLLVYNYTGRPMRIRTDLIGGEVKRAWWYSPRDGSLRPIGEVKDPLLRVQPAGGHRPGNDWVLIVADAELAWSLRPSEN